MNRTICVALASCVQARLNCLAKGDPNNWAERHTERAESLVRNHFPSGSGFDRGTTLNLDKSTGDKLVLETAFHHMDENGYYDGWTEHTVTVVASLQFGFVVKVGGRNRNQIKDYVADCFHHVLTLAEPLESAL